MRLCFTMYAGTKLYISHKLANQAKSNPLKERLESWGFVVVSETGKHVMTLVDNMEDVCSYGTLVIESL